MDCEDVADALSKRSPADITPEERDAIDAHVAACEACRRMWNPAEGSTALRLATKPDRDPARIRDSVMARIRGDTSGSGTRAAAESGPLPERIGGFEVLGVIARGGMGTVLKARQISMDRLVALKILPPRVADDEAFVNRFIREAHAAAKLRHPHIVQGHDAGMADGYYYFAMEYVDGEGLDAIVAREGPLEPERALRIMRQVCSALWAAHEAGIIHRDIKPSNLMLDSKGEVRVTDFGLAKRTEGDVPAGPAAPAQPRTDLPPAQSQALGTPAYVAPEVARGRPADPRSDLYSLGATFFHLLAGRAPFEGSNLANVLQKQIHEQPPPLADAAPHVDPRLCAIIDRLLCKGPEERLPSAQAVLAALDALGSLRSAKDLVRAEGRAMIQDAPTMPLTAGQQLEREAALEGRRLWWAVSRRRAALIAAAVAAACMLVVWLWPRNTGRPTTARRVDVRPSPTQDAPSVDSREQQAADLFRDAGDLALMMQWIDAKALIKRLDEDYSDTAFYKEQIVLIGKLRARINAAFQTAAAAPPPVQAEKIKVQGEPGEWISLFDGKTLNGWRVVERFPGAAGKFGDGTGGRATVQDGAIRIEEGKPASGIAWAGEFPTSDYELSLEAMRVAGSQDFATLTFPLGGQCATLLVGARQGPYTGLSMVDGRYYYPKNITTRQLPFAPKRWYLIRLRVTAERVAAWVDDEQLFGLDRQAHKIGAEIAWQAPVRPFGITTWKTTAALRNIRVRRLGHQPREPEWGEWVSLFKPGALAGWRVAKEGRFAKHGRVHLVDETVVLEPGAPATGIVCTSPFPSVNYEVAFEVRRDKGLNHAHVLFPVWPSSCILNLGGWDGNIVGLSLVDGDWAPGNGTARHVKFEPAGKWRWYRVRLRVTEEKVEMWVDDEKVIDLARAGRTLAPVNWPPEDMGFCLSNWESRSAFRNIKMRRREAAAPDEEFGPWVELFDGKALGRWQAVARFPDAMHKQGDGAGGAVRVADGQIAIEPGNPISGIRWTGPFPTIDYEVEVEAKRVDDLNAFCNLIFPLGDSSSALYVGAKRGTVAGLFQVDGKFFMNGNVTTRERVFEQGRWYRVRLRATSERVAAWVDDEPLFSVSRAEHVLDPAPRSVAPLLPFGIGTFKAGTALRAIRVRERTRRPAPALPDKPGEWAALFDGKTLTGWRVVEESDFAGHGPVRVVEDRITLGRGRKRTGVEWTGDFPRMHYELALEARREHGADNFCGMFLPVDDDIVGLDVGAWGGTVVGLTTVDSARSVSNDTTSRVPFELNRWYKMRVRVTPARIEVWVDDQKKIDLATEGRHFPRPSRFKPIHTLALATWATGAGMRNIRMQRLPHEPEKPPEDGTKLKAAEVVVSARGDWVDTGLFVTAGAPYAISATGRWGCKMSMANGPDGVPGGGHMPLVRGDGAYDLMGRIGRYGRRFRIGARAAFAPEESGRLYLGMNDQYPADNWGCVRARVEGPLLAEAGGPLVSRFPETVVEVQVRPTGGWVDSGITVRRGDRLLVSAQGFWVNPGEQVQVDPNGIDRSLGGLRAGALLGRIGEHGQRFVVGALHLLEAPEHGRLYLAVSGMEPVVRRGLVPQRAGWLGGLRDAALGRRQDGGPIAEGALKVTIRAAAGFKDAGDDRGLPCRLVATQGGTGGKAVAVSPDGKLLAMDSRTHSILLAHAATGAGIRQFRGHFDDLSALAFRTDGRQIVSASHDRTLRLWDVAEGRCVRTYAGHKGRVVSLAVSPDGAQFASSGDDGAVLVWDAAAGRVVRPLPGHRAGAYLAFSPDGSRLASACQDGWLRLWDTKTWQCVRTVFAQCGTCWAVAWAPDGSRLAVGGRMPCVRIWDPAKGERVRTLAVHNTEVRAVAWSPDGRRFIAAGRDGTVRIWDAATFKLARTIEAHSADAQAVALSPGGDRATSTGRDSAVRIWGLGVAEGAKVARKGEPE